MDLLERLPEPAPALRLEPWDNRLEVGLVPVPMRVLRFEEQDDLGPPVRDPVVR
jgi:hypothetical protein